MRFLLLTALILFLVASACAADIPNFPKPSAAPAAAPVLPAGVPSGCREWTDSCRICALDDKGASACSNVGIACMPQKWRCTRP